MFKLITRGGGQYGRYIISDEDVDNPAYAQEVEDYGGRLVAESVSKDYAPILAASELLYEACLAVIDYYDDCGGSRAGCNCDECKMLRKVERTVALIEGFDADDNV